MQDQCAIDAGTVDFGSFHIGRSQRATDIGIASNVDIARKVAGFEVVDVGILDGIVGFEVSDRSVLHRIVGFEVSDRGVLQRVVGLHIRNIILQVFDLRIVGVQQRGISRIVARESHT